MAAKALAVTIVLVALTTAQAYPHLWAQEAANCLAVPVKGEGCHKTPQVDKTTTITVSDAAGKAVTSVCPGKTYTIALKFPQKRLSYLTLNSGTAARANALNAKCKNTFTFGKPTGFMASTSVSVPATAPASGPWVVSVVSATGKCNPFMITKASVPVGKC